jgi:hypothetical protein
MAELREWQLAQGAMGVQGADLSRVLSFGQSVGKGTVAAMAGWWLLGASVALFCFKQSGARMARVAGLPRKKKERVS